MTQSVSSPDTPAQLPRQAGPAFAFLIGCCAYSLMAGGVVLLVWALAEGVVLPPVKEPVHPVSVFGVPAAVVCGLVGFTWLKVRRTLLDGKPGVAIGYLLLVPVAVGVVTGLLAAVIWLRV
jgi:hypothetical protein